MSAQIVSVEPVKWLPPLFCVVINSNGKRGYSYPMRYHEAVREAKRIESGLATKN